MEALIEEGWMDNAAKVGDYLISRLTNWAEAAGILAEIRGRGLMVGVELNQPIARKVMLAALENGLVFNAVGDSILRFLPPLIISESDVDEAIEKLQLSLEQVQAAEKEAGA
jgi:acetylornithine/succinyldiaminopimelate/putrescine aminotransferase